MRGPRKPCVRCGGRKQDGERRRLCDVCRPIAAEEYAEKARARARAHHVANRERRIEAMRARTAANPGESTRAGRAYRKRNPEADRIHRTARRARCRERVDPLVVLERADGVCGICSLDVDPMRFDVDHIIPLAIGGEHSYANTQPAHRLCNQRKWANAPEEVEA